MALVRSSDLSDVVIDEEKEKPKATATPPLLPKEKSADPITLKIISFGVGSMLIAVNLTANSLSLSKSGFPGAGSLTTAGQSLLLGICGGALNAGGMKIGKALGEKDLALANEYSHAALGMTAALATVSTLAYGTTYFLMPQIADPADASAATTYFLISALGNWPALALVTQGQKAFQLGDWKAPLASTFTYRVPAAALSYLLATLTPMGATGVGIANLITPWISYIGMECWLRKSKFEALNQTKFSLEVAKKHFKPFMQLGAKMSLQRITEWGNLALLTAMLGRISNTNLMLINPSLQIMTLFNLFSQGIGIAGNMRTAKERALLKSIKAEPDNGLDSTRATRMFEARNAIKATTKKSIAGGVIANSLLAGTLFFARKPIVNYFLPETASQESHDIAETALWINGTGLVFDAIRIITSNLLNSYDKISLPNILSLITMTIIGLPLGYAASDHESENGAVVPTIAMRTGMLLLAGLMNTLLLLRSMREDEEPTITVASERGTTPGLSYQQDDEASEELRLKRPTLR